MAQEINDGVLCVLVKKADTGRIDVNYFNYDIPFQAELNRFVALCENKKSTFKDIVKFLDNAKDLSQLDGEYRYCTEIAGSYQGFIVKTTKLKEEIIKEEERIIELNENENVEFDLEKAIADFKENLIKRYTTYCKAHAINKAYRICHDDKNVLTFSHRLCGWSNPDYKLTPNFSVEIKTNFGYGWSSYFFTKLRFKGVEITPFSEWIQYEFARVSEIVRYSQKYLLIHGEWESAMQYCKAACNLSLTDEEAFVSKYIVDECEQMVAGLEDLFKNSNPQVRGNNGKYYPLNKAGRLLIDYRGEKISGALDFISKILVFDKIASIKSFIKRIEEINKKIQPILVSERNTVNEEIKISEASLLMLKPKFILVCNKNKDYISKKTILRKQIASQLGVTPDKVEISELNEKFSVQYPDYKAFESEFRQTSQSYHNLVDHITNLNKILKSISTYIKSIDKYFNPR